ncbi:MAG TPA: hypothetical protein EYP10_04040 [Armatimonadetes bacterium]|nr:hypothetical protein [Armatimonadota bacterium]
MRERLLGSVQSSVGSVLAIGLLLSWCAVWEGVACGYDDMPSTPPQLEHTDMVSPRDFSYDALAKLAGAGLVPGYSARHFNSDLVYSRRQLAKIIASALTSASTERGAWRSYERPEQGPYMRGDEPMLLLQELAREFADELRPNRRIPLSIEGEKTFSSFSIIARLRPIVSYAFDSAPSIVRHLTNVTALYRIDNHTRFYLRLSASRQTSALESFNRPFVDTALLVTKFMKGRLEMGRKYTRWGPGYLGGMLLSDNVHPLDMIEWSGRIYVPIAGHWRLRYMLALLHGDTYGKRFLLARRVERRANRFLVFGLSEVQISKPFPTPLAFVMPLYPASRIAVRMGREEDSDEIIVSMDAVWTKRNGTRFYVEWLIDDLRLDRPAERQMGWLVGLQIPFNIEERRPGLTLEYARFDRNTYTHRNPKINYQYHGESLGYPTGPNSQVLFARLDIPMSAKNHLTVLGAAVEHGRKTNPDWEPYWGIHFYHDFTPNMSLGVRYTRGMPPRCGRPVLQGAWGARAENADYLSVEFNATF